MPDLVALVDPTVGGRAAQHALHARDELARVERLRQVVVGADLEPDDLVDVLVARGEHDDRHVGALADAAADLDPVHVGQVEVEDDQRRHLGGDRVQRPGARADRPHAVAGVLQVERDERRDRLLVLDDEHRGRAAHGFTGLTVLASTVSAAPNCDVLAGSTGSGTSRTVADRERARRAGRVGARRRGSRCPGPRAEIENPSPCTVIRYRPPGT